MMGVHYIFSTCLKFFLNRFLRFKKAETKQGRTGDGRSLLQHISRIWSIPLRVLFTQFFGKGEAWREERILQHPLGIQGGGISRSCTVSCKPGACARWLLRKVKQPVPLADSAVRCGGLCELIGSGSPCGAAFPMTSTLISRFSIPSSCEI